MLVAVIPLIVALVGVLMYALCANPKLARIGEILFFCGTLVTLLGVGNKSWHLGALDEAAPPLSTPSALS